MAFSDRELTCRDCSGAFEFTAGEQEFYASKGLQDDPVRCPSCRAQRHMMRPRDRDDTPNHGGYVSLGGRASRQLHVAVCSSCSVSTQVPFVPRGDRPVFCSDCYHEERNRLEELELAEANARAAAEPAAATVDTAVVSAAESSAPPTAWEKGLAFEEECRRKLEADGYEVETTKLTRDGGIDLIGKKRDSTGTRIVLVQCKDYKGPIGINDLQRFIGTARKWERDRPTLVFAASNGLTPDAQREASEAGVRVWTRSDLS